MFGKKQSGMAQLDMSELGDLLAGSSEFLRMWARPGGDVTCFVDPARLNRDPAALGLALVDCVRHGAKAYARAFGLPEEVALARIWEGIDAERSHPTDQPRPLDDKGRLN